MQQAYRGSARFLTVQWVLYPLVWALGTPGAGYIDPFLTTVLLIGLPIISKAGFGFYNLSKLRNLSPEVYEDQPEPSKPPGMAFTTPNR
ncbi:hypothetical protein DYU11_24335 [Fibrisoma montanum]|uniref:Uncharacterized protein n=1 Tax=Fibrisoma montanum TaxID=2305895 RepID=A0A418M2T1_9BACT|nr:hypothetical protein DYU11_24335 [Fibrisoma montanum]